MEAFAIIVFIFDRMKMLRLDETDAFIRLTTFVPNDVEMLRLVYHHKKYLV